VIPGEREEALVLSGGGAFAAYEVGVMKALFGGLSPATGYRPIDPHVVTGTSAGAFNCALLVDRWEVDSQTAIASMEQVWLDEVSQKACGNGIYRWRGNPFNLFDVRCLFADPVRYFWERLEDSVFFTENFFTRALRFARDRGPLDQRFLELFDLSNLISTHPFPRLLRRVIDFGHVRRSDKVLKLIATNWQNGEVEIYGRREMTDERGPLIIMGSSAIPGLFPVVDVPPRTVDGGVLMNTPLSPAIHAGATMLHVVYLDPEISQIPLTNMETTLDTLQRTFAIALANVFELDIANAQRINRSVVLLGGAREVSGDAAELRRLLPVIESVRSGIEHGREYRMLTIHRYHPHDLLGGALDMLNFDRDVIAGLIARGVRDAVDHDCRDCGCVLPPGVEPAYPRPRVTAARGPAPSFGSAA
jgi:NTE family protein